jgi:hypothetical protein
MAIPGLTIIGESINDPCLDEEADANDAAGLLDLAWSQDEGGAPGSTSTSACLPSWPTSSVASNRHDRAPHRPHAERPGRHRAGRGGSHLNSISPPARPCSTTAVGLFGAPDPRGLSEASPARLRQRHRRPKRRETARLLGEAGGASPASLTPRHHRSRHRPDRQRLRGHRRPDALALIQPILLRRRPGRLSNFTAAALEEPTGRRSRARSRAL